MRVAILLVLVVAGCAGDPPPAGTPLCTRALYDSCNSEHDCASDVCQPFSADGFQACTQGCSEALPCPMQGDQAVECNAAGVCEPPIMTVCEVQP